MTKTCENCETRKTCAAYQDKAREFGPYSPVHIYAIPENCFVPDKIKAEFRARSNRMRRDRDQAMKDLGLTRVKGMLGGVYWE